MRCVCILLIVRILTVASGNAKADIIQSYDVSGTDVVWLGTFSCSPVMPCAGKVN